MPESLLNANMRARLAFFDDESVIRAVDKATRELLSDFGREVRRSALASIRETPPNVRSAPGQPPYSHVAARKRAKNRERKLQGLGPLGRSFRGLKYILYAYDRAGRSVVIGPASNRVRSLTIPEILENGLKGVARRPFMGPAFERAKGKLPALWAGSVRA